MLDPSEPDQDRSRTEDMNKINRDLSLDPILDGGRGEDLNKINRDLSLDPILDGGRGEDLGHGLEDTRYPGCVGIQETEPEPGPAPINEVVAEVNPELKEAGCQLDLRVAPDLGVAPDLINILD